MTTFAQQTDDVSYGTCGESAYPEPRSCRSAAYGSMSRQILWIGLLAVSAPLSVGVSGKAQVHPADAVTSSVPHHRESDGPQAEGSKHAAQHSVDE